MERLQRQFLTISQKIELAKTELEIYRDKIKNGQKITSLIDKYNKSFDLIKERLGNSEKGLNATLTSSQTTQTEIEKVLESANTTLADIATKLVAAQTQVDAMNLKFDDFNKIKEKIDNPDAGLNATLTSSQTTQTEIEKVLESANTTLADIATKLVAAQTQVDAMNLKFDDFNKIKEKIDNPDTGLGAVLEKSSEFKNQINAVKEQSKRLFAEISAIRDESIIQKKDIKDIRKESEINAQKISNYEKESLDAKNKIEKIYKITTDSSLANSFADRKSEIFNSMIFWITILLLSSGFLLVKLFALQEKILDSGTIDIQSWLRLTVISPMFILVTYAGTQYKKERDLLEKYSFKAATALSLEAYTTLLMNKFGDSKKDISKFVLDSIRMIYKEPYSTKNQTKYVLKLGNKLGFIKTAITDITCDPIPEAKKPKPETKKINKKQKEPTV